MKITVNQLRRIIVEETRRSLRESPEGEALQRWGILSGLLQDSAPNLAALPGLQEEFVAGYVARNDVSGDAVKNEMWILLGAIDKLI